MSGKFGFSNMPLSLYRLSKFIDFVTRYTQSYFSLFFHIMYAINNDQMAFCMYNVM